MSKRRTELRRDKRAIKPLSITEPWIPLVQVDPATAIRGDISSLLGAQVWMNNVYIVIARQDEKGAMHLSIHRHDNDWVRDWRALQAIKNQLAGPETEALELFPAESRLVDTANSTNIWVMPPGVQIPIGWPVRLVSEATTPRSRQRLFTDKPADLVSTEDMHERLAIYIKDNK